MASITVAEYLFTRLRQCGLTVMFGVPGDYNLKLLDHVEPSGLRWVGNCNELNAGYAADGYARVIGVGSLITTFGVGELSAINAIAGAYTERAPVVHIVGTPPRQARTDKLFVHHSMGDGDFLHFADMYKHVTVAQARLWDTEAAPEQIDSALKKCLEERRPIYISLPDDMVNDTISSERLSKMIEVDVVAGEFPQELLDRILNTKKPVILVDGECFGVKKEINMLAEETGWPTFVSVFGKSLVDEVLHNFLGIWNLETEHHWRDSDLILNFGPHHSGTNTYMFSSIPDSKITMSFKMKQVEYQGKTWDCSMKTALQALLQLKINKTRQVTINKTEAQVPNPRGELITQSDFYNVLSASRLFKPGDNILAETGTASTGSRDFLLPRDAIHFKAVTWLSIGYMLPASLGAALARRSRTILLIGDGSFQMTAQELSTIIKQKLNYLLILVNNDGYTIERCIHGKDEKYNDVARWNYLHAPSFFGGESQDYPVRTASAKTWKELNTALDIENNDTGSAFSMIEVHMTREDAPRHLLPLLEGQYPEGLPAGFPHHHQ